MSLESLLNAWPIMLIALMIGLGLVLVLALALDAGTRFRLEWFSFFFVAVPISLVAGVLIQGRTLGIETLGGWRPEFEDFRTTSSGSRVLTLICLALGAERVVRFILRQDYRGAQGAPLLWVFLVYVLCVNFISGAFGTAPTFSHQFLYAPLFALAMFAYAQQNVERMIPMVRHAMLGFLLVSLLALILKPSMVAEFNYRAGLIPKLGLRFYGFATHPNTLAPLCFVLMCCMFLRPFERAWLRRSAWTVAWVCLLLTQSKTSVGLAAALMAALYGHAAVRRERERAGRLNSTQRGLQIAVMTMAALAAAGSTLLILVLFSEPVFTKISQALANAQFSSLSGRTTIWNETLKAVQANPLFGYGPGLWGASFQQKIGLFFTHAHNQYFQTLGAAGIVGLAALLGYLFILSRNAWKVRHETHGVSVALTFYLILRGLTEVPLSVSTAMQSEFLVQLFLLALIWGSLRRQAVAAGPAANTSRVYMPGRFAQPPPLHPASD